MPGAPSSADRVAWGLLPLTVGLSPVAAEMEGRRGREMRKMLWHRAQLKHVYGLMYNRLLIKHNHLNCKNSST